MNTIKSRVEIDCLFKTGRFIKTSRIAARVAKIPEGRDQNGRVACVAGKKLGNAVIRNRSKRVLKETLRRCGGPWRGYSVVLIARQKTATAKPNELDDDYRALSKFFVGDKPHEED